MELVTGLTETQYTDFESSVGEHEYCVLVVYTEPDCTSDEVCVLKNVLAVGDCNTVTNFAGTGEIYNNTLTWNKPEVNPSSSSTLLGYKIYRNNTFLVEIEDVDVLTYTDSNNFEGTQEYCIEALYDDCVSEQVCIQIAPDCFPPANITATMVDADVRIEWGDSPSGKRQIMFTEDFENTSTFGDLPEGWTSLDADGDGLNWYPTNQYDIPGHSGNGMMTSESWSDVALTPDNYLITPMAYNAVAINYWVSAQDNQWAAEHYAIMASDTGTAASDFTIIFEETLTAKESKTATPRGTNAQGNWYERYVELPTGTTYVAFRHFNSTDNFRINIDDVTLYEILPGDFTYGLFRDGVELDGNIYQNHYLDKNVPAGSHEYCVRRSAAHCTSDFNCTTLIVTNMDNAQMEGVKVYPNPATDVIHIQGDVKEIMLFNSLGQVVKTGAYNNNQLDVSSLTNGIYHLVMTTNGNKQVVEKVVIAK